MGMYKILIQNDNAEDRTILFTLLQEFDEDFEMYEAKQIEEALYMIQNKKIQIMFLDESVNIDQILEKYPFVEYLVAVSSKDSDLGKSRTVHKNVRYVERPIAKDALKIYFIEAMHRMVKQELEEFKWNEQSYDKDFVMEKQAATQLDEVYLKELQYAITLKNSDAMRVTLGKVIQQYTELEFKYPYMVRSVYTAVLHTFVKAVPSKMNDIERMIEYIFTAEDFRKIEKLLYTYMEIVISEFETEASSSNRVIYQVKQYINTHYYEDLKLQQLAEQVYLSANYLSNIFTKHTGSSLNKYIKEVRLKKAQEILLSTNMKVADVGRRVGYDNTSYFIKKFQEKFGMTPDKYRMNPVEQEEIWNVIE